MGLIRGGGERDCHEAEGSSEVIREAASEGYTFKLIPGAYPAR
jgi:hypothetical protein